LVQKYIIKGLGPKPILGKLEGKVKILSTHNLLCRTIATFCPACIFSHDAVASSGRLSITSERHLPHEITQYVLPETGERALP